MVFYRLVPVQRGTKEKMNGKDLMEEIGHTGEESEESYQPEEQSEDVVTIVLTADNHLGSGGFSQQPQKREEFQQRLRQAFQQSTDFAIVQGVDLFIQAGDLFDNTEPSESDRSFVATRLAQLKQAGVHTFALGGMHDTPAHTAPGGEKAAPQVSYERLGALHYFAPTQKDDKGQLEPIIVNVHGITLGICGLGAVAGQEGDPFANLRVQLEIERADIPILILHAPIEGLSSASSPADATALATRENISKQSVFPYILAGYQHNYHRLRIDQTEVVVAGATQYIDFTALEQEPGFVFLGVAADGIRWCNHIKVDSLSLRPLVLSVDELWSDQLLQSPTNSIIERLRPLCDDNALVQIHLEGELTRSAYHLLDLNRVRLYGEEHCFGLAIDDSKLTILSEEESFVEHGQRISLREELQTCVDDWIAAAPDEQEKESLAFTREALLSAMDEMRNR